MATPRTRVSQTPSLPSVLLVPTVLQELRYRAVNLLRKETLSIPKLSLVSHPQWEQKSAGREL